MNNERNYNLNTKIADLVNEHGVVSVNKLQNIVGLDFNGLSLDDLYYYTSEVKGIIEQTERQQHVKCYRTTRVVSEHDLDDYYFMWSETKLLSELIVENVREGVFTHEVVEIELPYDELSNLIEKRDKNSRFQYRLRNILANS